MADYLVPMAAEMPDIHVGHVETPTKESLLGAKGAGEAGTAGAPGALMNAINDALRPLGARRDGTAFHPGPHPARAGNDLKKFPGRTKDMITPRRSLLVGASALPLFSIRAQAQSTLNITIASSHPVAVFWVAMMKNVFQPEVDKILRDNGNTHKINWREAYGGTLYRFQDTMEAVRDNITDIGYVGTLWEGSTMPLQNVTYFTPFATGDHGVVANAFERMNETVPAIRQNWEGLNMIPFTSYITDSYHLWTNFPVRSVDDLRNRKISAPGTSANWLQGTGATPVDGALTTYYTDIQTGVSEGALVLLRRHPADARL